MRTWIIRPVLLLALLLSAAWALSAQTAQITGRVTDSTGAVIPGATVEATNVQTRIERTALTNAEGYYALPSLQPGQYELRVEFAGMKTIRRDGIVLAVAQVARLDFVLEVGDIEQVVEVSAEAPLVNSESATVGQVVENRRITDLPLNGRNTLALVMLVPGARSQAGPTNSGFGDRGIALSSVSLNGGPSALNAFLLDGNTNNSGQNYEVNVNPSVDAVEEFKVQTNTMSAEYGFTAGGVINMVTKSGTNDLRGSLYYFVRNDVLDARNAFAAVRAPFRYNQFGGAVGGPVLVPRLYNGRNRTFFFFNYEDWRFRRYNYPISTVPTLQQRSGDFSDLRDSKGNLIPVYDPFTTKANPAGAGFVRDPFPGNVIPAGRIDPVSKNALELVPTPNRTPINPFTSQDNLISSIREERYMKQATTRLDHRFSDANSLFGRYTFYRHFTNGAIGSNPWPNPVVNQRLDTLTQQNFVLADTHIVSPTMLNELRLGIARTHFPFVARSYGEGWPRKLGLPESVPNDVLPRISISGLPGFTQSDVGFRGTLTWDISNTVTVTRAGHTMKFGAEYRQHQINNLQRALPSGRFVFSSALTTNPQRAAGTGNGFTTFLLGAVSNATLGTYLGYSQHSYSTSFFFQDDWKVTPRLTLNLGLRYDFQDPPVERNNGVSNFNPYEINPDNGLLGRMEYAGLDYDRTYLSADALAFSPRVGLAYDLFGDKKTVVRAGYGVFRPSIAYREFFGNTAGFAVTNTSYLPAGGNTNFPAFQFRDGFPYPPTSPLGAQLGPSAFLSSSVNYDQANDKYPLTQQWNVSLQHQLPGGWLVDATYSANKGTHLVAGAYDYNQLDPKYQELGLALQNNVPNPYAGMVPGAYGGATIRRSQLLRPYPYYGNINVRNPAMGNSIYHAFLLSVQKRLSNGFAVLASYTNAKLIDDSVRAAIEFGAVEQTNQVGYQNGKFNRAAERSIDPTDVSQRFVLSAIYELPFGQGKRWSASSGTLNKMIGGWQVNTITTIQSGLPVIVRGASNFLANRPNSTGQSARLDERSAARWFNTDAFVNPPNFTYGNVGRVLPDVRHPGVVNVDLSLIKDTRIRERVKLQFRAEAFNVANNVNLGFANASFSPGPDGLNRSATFGTIRSARDARIVQLGLKLVF